jgi:hypothetical protein
VWQGEGCGEWLDSRLRGNDEKKPGNDRSMAGEGMAAPYRLRSMGQASPGMTERGVSEGMRKI